MGKAEPAAGTYSFIIRSENSSYLIAVGQGSRQVGFVLTSVSSPSDTQTMDDALPCVRHADVCSVGALKMSDGVFYFQLPRGERVQSAQQPSLIEQVPVLFAEK